MTSDSLKRLLAESVDPSAPPVLVPPGAAQREMLEALDRALGGEDTYIGAWSDTPLLSITIQVDVVVEERFGQPFQERLVVAFRGDRLSLGPGHHFDEAAVPLAGPAHLRRAVATVRERLEGQARQALRRDKLRKLGRRAVTAKIEALARRMDFSFYVEWLTTWFRLAVALDHDEAIFFKVAYQRADERLAEVERVVTEVRKLRAEGARFTIGPVDPERLGRPDLTGPASAPHS